MTAPLAQPVSVSAVDQLLTVADIAGIIGCHEDTVRGWINAGHLPAAKYGTRIGWRIQRCDFEAFHHQRTLTSAITRQLLQVSDDSTLPPKP
jgi:excisionase family DNA binding protein